MRTHARPRDLRLVPAAVIVWASAGAAIVLPAAAGWLGLALWAGALGSLVMACTARRGRRLGALAAVALALAAAAASHVALAEPARAAASALPVDGGRALEVQAIVVGKVERTAGRQWRFDAQASLIAIGRDSVHVDVPVVVQVAPDDVRGDGLDVGAVIVASGTAFRADAGDRAVLVVRASQHVRVVSGPGGLAEVTAALRRGLVRAVRGLPDPGGGLVPGLAVGDTSAVSGELDAAMKQSSLSHLTAVSGANCAIVVGLAFAAAAALRARRSVRVGAGIVALFGFVALVTPEPSVVRSAAMAAIAMLGVALGRLGAGVSLLTLATSAVLIGDPWLAASLGFALSVAATGALLVLTRPLAAGLSRWMPRGVALALAVPLAAQLACGPLLIVVNPTVPLYGVLANLLAAPAAPVATVVGLAACLAVAAPVLQSGLAALAWLPAAWIAATAQAAVALPASALPWLGGVPGVVSLALVGTAVTILIVAPRRAGRFSRVARAIALLTVAAVSGTVGGLSALTGVAGSLTLPTSWSIVACDVGQGDALLVRSGGQVAVIDTGPTPAPLQACLTKLGIGRVQLLVLTHFDLDHAGGVDAVRGRVDVVLHGPAVTASQRALLDRLAAGGARLVAASAGLAGDLGEARWEVVWPTAQSRGFPSGNSAGVILDIRGGAVPTSLFLADLDASAERALLASGRLRPPYGVVKVAHHGSADQAPELYQALGAVVAVISVGVGNDYGHPRASTLALLAGLTVVVARTDRDGLVALSTSPTGVVIWRERAPPPVGAGG